MHHRQYLYSSQKQFLTLVLHENSYSTGKGIRYDITKLKNMMQHKMFQPEPATIELLGRDNPPTFCSLDAKLAHRTHVQENKNAAAVLKKKKIDDKLETTAFGGSQTFPCPNVCHRIFLTRTHLLKHLAANKCSISKSARRNSRSKLLVTRTNTLNDEALKKVAEGSFSSVVTVIQSHKERRPAELSLTQKRSQYRLVSGGKWKASIPFLTKGYARKKRWSGRTRYSPSQLQFLEWAFSLGKKDANRKITAEKAADVMRVVGTNVGHQMFPDEPYMRPTPTDEAKFFRHDLIEKYEIKSFFSRKKSEIMKDLARMN